MKRMVQMVHMVRLGHGPLAVLCAAISVAWPATSDLLAVQIQSPRVARPVQERALIEDQIQREEMPHPSVVAEKSEPDSKSPMADDQSALATLMTDPDLETSLETAERFRNDDNYRVATQLWQAILTRSGDSLYSSDGITYFSMVRQVEQILSDLPPEGLAAYRVLADAEAKEILAEASDPNSQKALSKVVRYYFLSSLGDDAAFRLGCIYLDHFDFIGAQRMFEKIKDQYPDSSIPSDQILLRIAMCQSYLGQTDAAKKSLKSAQAIAGKSDLSSQIQRSLGLLVAGADRETDAPSWRMTLGSSLRYGTMPSLPAEIMKTDLVAKWQFFFQPADTYRLSDTVGAILAGDDANNATAARTVSSVEKSLIEKWREGNWRPTGNLLFDGGRIYFRAAADLVVWEGSKISAMIDSPPNKPKIDNAVQWRSLWRNAFEVDETTQMLQAIRRSWGEFRNRNGSTSDSPAPKTSWEVQLFGDRIQSQISIAAGLVFALEGKRYDDRNRNRTRRITPQWNASFRRLRTNRLTAYDAASGRAEWTLPVLPDDADGGRGIAQAPADAGRADAHAEGATDGAKDWDSDLNGDRSPFLESGGFMSAPVGFGDWILVPVNQGGAISIYALDPRDEGRTVWKSFLCDEPETGAESWSAINLTLDGSDLFVNCGMGVVFVLDPTTGLVRFAKRYRRVGTSDQFRRGWTVSHLNFHGWSNDTIIPFGRQMICFSSDTDTIVAYDRTNGDLIWKSAMSPIGFKVDYLLGVYDGLLYAAGRETVVAYDLNGEGRMIWGADSLFEGQQSFGRGMLTPDGIYLPVEDAIYHYSLPTLDRPAKLQSRVQVDFGTSAPVGNLYSDGTRLWVHGGNRLFALEPDL